MCAKSSLSSTTKCLNIQRLGVPYLNNQNTTESVRQHVGAQYFNSSLST